MMMPVEPVMPAGRSRRIPTGPAAAGLIAAGVGCFTFGLLVILAEASPGVAGLFNWYSPVGPLSGKTGAAMVVWLVTWLVLARAWTVRDVDLRRAWRVTLVLIGFGFLATFPPFFELFG